MRAEGSHRKQHPHANRKLVQFHPSPLYSSSNGAPPKARKPFSRHRKERFGILTKNRLAVGFARVAKYYAKDPTWREGGALVRIIAVTLVESFPPRFPLSFPL